MSDLSPITLDELRGLRDALLRARLNGTRRVSYDGRETEYRTDSEMRAALADAERRIAILGGETRISQIRVFSSKGFGE